MRNSAYSRLMLSDRIFLDKWSRILGIGYATFALLLMLGVIAGVEAGLPGEEQVAQQNVEVVP